VWKLNVTGTSCGFAVPIPGEISFEQTLCPGERITLALPVDLGGGACGGGAVSATETSIHFTCSGPYSEGSCTGTIQAVFDIALQPANGTLGGSGELKVQFEPGADCSSGYCYKLAITGQRISSTPDCPPPSGSQESFLGRVRTPIRSRG
jgi:hypothetical protein